MRRSVEDEFGGAPLPPLLCSEAEREFLEAKNGLDLAIYSAHLACKIYAGAAEFHLTPELVCEFNRIAMSGIYDCAGTLRKRLVVPGDFVPPHHELIPWLVESFCNYVNSSNADPFRLSAHVLWRINWIHPFYDGNGRTARELSYLTLLARLQVPELAGTNSILGQLDRTARDRYFDALRAADLGCDGEESINIEPLESLLLELYQNQMESA
ncbi:MAG: Fic family protein [Planctomycetaceae bacterium]|nr:Fic family protein [Planctomycetaceae bacterium]